MTWDRNGCNGLGTGAVGYWGRDIFRRIAAEGEHNKQRALLMDQILAGGIRSEMWRSVLTGQRCSCYKEANQASDRKCMACHGSGYVPGYLKFGYETLWMSAVDSDVTLTDVRITTDFKSSKIELNPGALSGTVESADKAFHRSILGASWEAQAVDYVRVAGSSSVTVEYSTDSGSNWFPISNLSTDNPVTGTIRFRATLTRVSAEVLSPLFEIVRARFRTIDYSRAQGDGSYRLGPWLLLMRSIPVSRKTKSQYADLPQQANLKVWTSGLSMFDSSVAVGSMDELIKQGDGSDVLFQIMDGVQVGRRYKVTTWSPSDPFATIVVQQTFDIRYADPVGPYSQVW